MEYSAITLELGKLLITGVAAAWFTRFLTDRSERKRKKMEWVATKLEVAYGQLCDAAEYPGMPPEEAFARKQNLSKAFNSIDLYADERTKTAAIALHNAYIGGNSWVEYGPLQTALRDSFRENIGLPKLHAPVVVLNFLPPTKPPNQ
jgi:hypothetical protein